MPTLHVKTYLLSQCANTAIRPEHRGFNLEKTTQTLTSFVLKEKHTNSAFNDMNSFFKGTRCIWHAGVTWLVCQHRGFCVPAAHVCYRFATTGRGNSETLSEKQHKAKFPQCIFKVSVKLYKEEIRSIRIFQ